MNTLIINGSPRKNGDTAFLITELRSHLNGEVMLIDTYSTKISPCTDCRYCWKNENCAINDEMDNVLRDIDKADNIVIASPIYFSELTGSLLNFASRLQYLWVSKNFRKARVLQKKQRNGFVILVGGGDGNTDKALSTAKCLLSHMDAVFTDYVVSHNTNTVPAWNDDNAIRGIRGITEKMSLK